MNKGLIAIIAAAALAAVKSKTADQEGSAAKRRITNVFDYYDLNSKRIKINGQSIRIISEEVRLMGDMLGYDQDSIDSIAILGDDLVRVQVQVQGQGQGQGQVQGLALIENIKLYKTYVDDFEESLKRLFISEVVYYLNSETPFASEIATTALSKQFKQINPIEAAISLDPINQPFTGILTAMHLIQIDLEKILSIPKRWRHGGQSKITQSVTLFQYKSIEYRYLKDLLIDASTSGLNEFKYLVNNPIGIATITSIKNRTKLTEFHQFIASRRKNQGKRLDFVEIADDLVSGVEIDEVSKRITGGKGVLEVIRYSPAYMKNPLAFSLYIRTMLALESTFREGSILSAGKKPYALNGLIGSNSFTVTLLKTDPYNMDPVKGIASDVIVKWAESALKKMDILDQLLFSQEFNFDKIESERNIYLFCKISIATINKFLDMNLFTNILTRWRKRQAVTNELIDDLHFLAYGFLYKAVTGYYLSNESNLADSTVCDPYFNSMLPFGLATVESYTKMLESCISGIGIPNMDYQASPGKTADNSDPSKGIIDALGFMVDKVSYNMASESVNEALLSEDLLVQIRGNLPYFQYRWYGLEVGVMTYFGTESQMTVLVNKKFPLIMKALPQRAAGGQLAVAAQQELRLGNYDLYRSLINDDLISKTEWTAKKSNGFYFGTQVDLIEYIDFGELTLLARRMRTLGYWWSKVCIHLFRVLKSSQRSLAWYLMSPITNQKTIDVSMQKYVDAGLIDPEVGIIGGESSESDAWHKVMGNRYFNSTNTMNKFRSTMGAILSRISQFLQKPINEFNSLHNDLIQGNTNHQTWRTNLNSYFNYIGGNRSGLTLDDVGKMATAVGDGQRLMQLSKAFKKNPENILSDYVTFLNKIQQRTFSPELQNINTVLDFQESPMVKMIIKTINSEWNSSKRILSSKIFEQILTLPFRNVLSSIARLFPPELRPKPRGYEELYFGRSFREPYVKHVGKNQKNQEVFEGMVDVWEGHNEIIAEAKGQYQEKAPKAQCRKFSRVKTKDGLILGGDIVFIKAGDIEKEFSKMYSNATIQENNLLIVNEVFVYVAKQLGLVDDGEHSRPENINSLSLGEFLRLTGFYGGGEDVDVERIMRDVSKSTKVVEDQFISYFKLNRVPYVKGSSVAAYNAYLQAADGSHVDEAEGMLANLATTMGVPLFPYISIAEESNTNEYVYGQYKFDRSESFVFYNYNGLYMPIIGGDGGAFIANNNKMPSIDSALTGNTAFLELQEIQTDNHTFKKGINRLSCQVYYGLLSQVMTNMSTLQLDAFAGVGGQFPMYLKVREQSGGVGILNDDPMGFATMYSVLADHGQILHKTDKISVVGKTSNPAKVIESSMSSDDVKINKDTISKISTLLANHAFANVVQYVQFGKNDEVTEWGSVNNPIDRAIISLAGPFSNHRSNQSQANKWKKSKNEIDKIAYVAYWNKYNNLGSELGKNIDAINDLIDIKVLIASKIPSVTLSKFNWSELVKFPDSLSKFKNYLKEDLRGFMDIPESEVNWQVKYRTAMQQQASKNDGMGIRGLAYKGILNKIYSSYQEVFNNSVVVKESQRIGELAFMTPSGYRVYVPMNKDDLEWISRSCLGGSSSLFPRDVDKGLANMVGKLPDNFIPRVSSSTTSLCIGWDNQNYDTRLLSGNQIHFTVVRPDGKLRLVSTFDLQKDGSWKVNQIMNDNNSNYSTSSLSKANYVSHNANFKEDLMLLREFLSGVRDWAKNPTIDGPDGAPNLWEIRKIGWKTKVPKYIGSDNEIYEGITEIFKSSYVSNAASAESKSIPYTTRIQKD